jgi:hypothetical protein
MLCAWRRSTPALKAQTPPRLYPFTAVRIPSVLFIKFGLFFKYQHSLLNKYDPVEEPEFFSKKKKVNLSFVM